MKEKTRETPKPTEHAVASHNSCKTILALVWEATERAFKIQETCFMNEGKQPINVRHKPPSTRSCSVVCRKCLSWAARCQLFMVRTCLELRSAQTSHWTTFCFVPRNTQDSTSAFGYFRVFFVKETAAHLLFFVTKWKLCRAECFNLSCKREFFLSLEFLMFWTTWSLTPVKSDVCHFWNNKRRSSIWRICLERSVKKANRDRDGELGSSTGRAGCHVQWIRPHPPWSNPSISSAGSAETPRLQHEACICTRTWWVYLLRWSSVCKLSAPHIFCQAYIWKWRSPFSAAKCNTTKQVNINVREHGELEREFQEECTEGPPWRKPQFPWNQVVPQIYCNL